MHKAITHRLSIIIPIYNAEKYLDETIQSIISQSYGNWELILVDDGSTDKSVEIAEKYLQNPAIKLVLQENQGVSVARNNGLLLANGDYIFFLDSDDTIDERFLETSLEVAIQGDFDITIVGDYFLRKFENKNNVPALATCAMFLKNDFIRNNPNIRFPEKIQPCEDGLFSHQLLALTDKIGFNPKGIYHYRKHENQNTANLDASKILEQIPKWFEILENFYQKNNLFQEKALHLARFLQHEPYGFRYLKLTANEAQKDKLFSMIRSFFNEKVAPFLTKEDKKLLNPTFIYFLECKNREEFDNYYKKYLLRLKILRKLYLSLIKIFYFGKKKKRKKEKINYIFDHKLDL